MFNAKSGLSVERLSDGAVRILVKDEHGPQGRVVADFNVDADTWCSLIAQMSYYGEEDYGFYRAQDFHLGYPMPDSMPLKDKRPNV